MHRTRARWRLTWVAAAFAAGMAALIPLADSAAQRQPSVDCASYEKAWRRISRWNNPDAARSFALSIPAACRRLRDEALAQTAPRSPPRPIPAPAAGQPDRPADGQEELDWRRANSIDSDEAYDEYLRRHPDGVHASTAVAALRKPYVIRTCNDTGHDIWLAKRSIAVNSLNTTTQGWVHLAPGECDESHSRYRNIAIYAKDNEGNPLSINNNQSERACVRNDQFMYLDSIDCKSPYTEVAFRVYRAKSKTDAFFIQ